MVHAGAPGRGTCDVCSLKEQAAIQSVPLEGQPARQVGVRWTSAASNAVMKYQCPPL